jgi:hypothetical protein
LVAKGEDDPDYEEEGGEARLSTYSSVDQRAG